jgi:hypothetical protein
MESRFIRKWLGLHDDEATFFCFSPPIMIATFSIEILLALYTFIRSRKAGSDLGIVYILVFLAVFQLSEYQICGHENPLLWSRIGFFVITLLPVLGYWIATRFRKRHHHVIFAFIVALLLALALVIMPKSIVGSACLGNYVIFSVQPSIYTLFSYYYYTFLLLGLWQAVMAIEEHPKKEKLKRALKWYIFGYLSFLVPMMTIFAFVASARAGATSIMCGFAVIFAVVLTFLVAPVYDQVFGKKDSK